jgi:hypothetical protein
VADLRFLLVLLLTFIVVFVVVGWLMVILLWHPLLTVALSLPMVWAFTILIRP